MSEVAHDRVAPPRRRSRFVRRGHAARGNLASLLAETVPGLEDAVGRRRAGGDRSASRGARRLGVLRAELTERASRKPRRCSREHVRSSSRWRAAWSSSGRRSPSGAPSIPGARWHRTPWRSCAPSSGQFDPEGILNPGRFVGGPVTGVTPLAPSLEEIRKCVHCGICLPQCPTYRVLGEEMDSPRGRIYLMRAAAEGRASLSESFARHMDLCLGCRACETACPSGVAFGSLIEATRAQLRSCPPGLAPAVPRARDLRAVPVSGPPGPGARLPCDCTSARASAPWSVAPVCSRACHRWRAWRRSCRSSRAR